MIDDGGGGSEEVEAGPGGVEDTQDMEQVTKVSALCFAARDRKALFMN